MTKKFRIAFFSEVNSKFGMPFFKKIYGNSNFEIVVFVTTPTGKVCSYYAGEPNPVNLEKFAIEKKIPVYRPDNIKNDDFCSKIAQHKIDYIIIANYQKILNSNLINIPKYGTFNFHPSPLPRYAGLAPFFWMAKHSEHNSGVSCIEVSTKIDGGNIVKQIPVMLTGNETSLQIRNKLFEKSLNLLDDVLNSIVEGTISSKPQDLNDREYFGNPQINDMTITSDMTISEAIATMKACAPNFAYLDYENSHLPVEYFGYTSRKNTLRYKFKDGELSFLMSEPTGVNYHE